jgi:tetratricopeptide (TPR) repeat protein
VIGLPASVCAAQETRQIALDTSESLFTVLTAINVCGYDSELDAADPLRGQIRSEVESALQASEPARNNVQTMCQTYTEHQQPDASRNLSQYISLALYLNPPPELSAKGKESDLPPDAAAVLGIVPAMRKFYEQAGLHAIWQRHAEAYTALTENYHAPVAKMLFDTEVYLKLPSAGYLGRGFTVYLDPMGAPGQTNARNYGSDYYVVISPGKGSALKMEQIRHTYLHYLLDPLTMKYPTAVKHLEPLLETVKTSPLDENFKSDAGLLATECFIRAIEIRTGGSRKMPETAREQLVDDSQKQGFILTGYFYEALVQFEKDPAGLRSLYSDMLTKIDTRKEEKQAAQIQFASKADPEILHLARPVEGNLLSSASQKLSVGDLDAAKKLAQQALDEKSEDPGRALFILAQAATMSRDLPGARDYFLRTLEVAHEPKVVAWSHIYLGRIFDLQEEREAALGHYRAALSSGAELPEAKAAAERGIQQPYEPPSHPSKE